MKKRSLVITKSIKDMRLQASPNEILYSYNFKQGTLCSEGVINFNNAKLLNDLALVEKQDYTDFIYSKNQLFLEQKLIFNDNLSLYFLSLFSNKRTEFFSTYIYYLHLRILINILKENSFNSISCIGFTAEEVTQLSLNLGQTVQSKDKQQNTNRVNIVSLRNIFFLFNRFRLFSFFEAVFK